MKIKKKVVEVRRPDSIRSEIDIKLSKKVEVKAEKTVVEKQQSGFYGTSYSSVEYYQKLAQTLKLRFFSYF